MPLFREKGVQALEDTGKIVQVFENVPKGDRVVLFLRGNVLQSRKDP